MFSKKRIKIIPSLRIAFNYSFLFILISTILCMILPKFLGLSENIKIRDYIFSALYIQIISLIICLAIIKIMFIKIDYWYVLSSISKYKDKKRVAKIRRKCLKAPYIIGFFQFVTPLIVAEIYMCSYTDFSKVLITKILLFISSFTLLLSIYSIVYIQKVNEEILKRTYTFDNVNIGIRVDIAAKLFLQALPICLVCIVTISYLAYSNVDLIYIIYTAIVLLILSCISLYYFTSSTFKQLSKVTNSFNNLSKNRLCTRLLPLTSNDEIGDLIKAFNKVQKINNSNLLKIKEDQDKLMERERLSSLGELIGGIAHNMKTPIMSISGATEALKDLVEEYNSSIEDPEVNVQDHYDIAKDMNTWINKINSYTEYMSDIITTVKGQAVTFSDSDISEFSIDELLKRINILMNHELKKAQAKLNIKLDADKKTLIKGNINSLIQVINNMISNSIQAYGEEKEKEINLSIFKEKLYIIIKIQDFAGGLPDEVSKKLFKKMITTKGKNGTGIGLFMSYSNIRAQFNGDIEFTTEKGIGTTFYISIPYITNL